MELVWGGVLGLSRGKRLYNWKPVFGGKLLGSSIRRGFGALKGQNAFPTGNLFAGNNYLELA